MPILTTEQAVDHCRADPDEDTAMLDLYLKASIEAAQDYLGRQLYTDQAEMDAAVAAGTAGEEPMVATFAIKAAILLICGHLFSNREDTVVGGGGAIELPLGSRSLLRPHRRNHGP